jgi:hypothetical protein
MKKFLIIAGVGLLVICIGLVVGGYLLYSQGFLKTYETGNLTVTYPAHFTVTVGDDGIPQFMDPLPNVFGGNDVMIVSNSNNPYDEIEIKDQKGCSDATTAALLSEQNIKFKEFPDRITYEKDGEYGICNFYTEIEQNGNVLSMTTRIYIAEDQSKTSLISVYDKNGVWAFKVEQAMERSLMK